MSSLFEMYTALYERLKEIHTGYTGAESQLSAAKEQDSLARLRRIENLEAQLVKIEEYAEKVDYFRRLAEKHLQSKNLLTITPRELNFNRMRNWAMKINPLEPDDPYAQRIYVQAMCNEMFLRMKKEEFEKTLQELKNQDTSADEQLVKAVETLKEKLTGQCAEILESKEFRDFGEALKLAHEQYTDRESLETVGNTSEQGAKTLGLGGYAQPFPVMEQLKSRVKAVLEENYDSNTGYVLLPVELPAEKESILSVVCSAGKEKKVYRGLQSYLLNYMKQMPEGTGKIYVLDALHYNNTALGELKPLEGTICLETVPKDPEAVVDTLRQIVSSLADTDELIGMYDSVEEYNASVNPEERIPRQLLVLIGYPSAFSGEAREYIKRLLYNFEHYGISMVLMDNQYTERGNDGKVPGNLPVELVQGIARVQMLPQREMISLNNGQAYAFRWYEWKQDLSETFVARIKSMSAKAGALGTEYVKRVDMENYPAYVRGNKSIVLPYGVDQKDQVHSISFDNENFASYLMGASGSGKSTLLHTLITGIIRNYHPDDVELWLADFKMSEFAQYIHPLPPHVKYILLDESRELVYDLIDKLTEKMMERQRFFMSPEYRELKKVENVPKQKYMPIIFVILDEFSMMSQAVAESEYYKLRLQNLLAKGRALGIKFIFASQTFTKGIGGLSSTAKDQIQSRIAMKNSYSEINETLELSADLRTDQVRGWMNALPPHYTLMKYRDGDVMRVKRLQVMYFKGKGDEALLPQRRLIEYRKNTLLPVETYDPENENCYVEKHPVIVDGNSYRVFDEEQVLAACETYKKESLWQDQEEVLISFGTPRRMAEHAFAAVSRESRENLLLMARSAEQACAMSVLASAIKQFEKQGARIRVWAYHKNRLYQAYKDTGLSFCQKAEGLEAICGEIRQIKEQIRRKEQSNELIVLLGMEQICSDFGLIDFTGTENGTSKETGTFDAEQLDVQKLEAKTEEEKEAVAEVNELEKELDPILEAIEEEGMMAGKSMAEILQEIEEATDAFFRERGGQKDAEASEANAAGSEPTAAENEEPKKAEETEAEAEPQAYNAQKDFVYIVRQGSRFGYHFMLCVNNMADFRNTGLQPELFRHKLAFQLAGNDSMELFGDKSANKLPEHICQYSNSLEQYSFRPYLHRGITWDGWDVDEDGQAVNGYTL